MNNDIDNAIKNAISNIEHIYGIVSTDIQRSLDLAIKALEFVGKFYPLTFGEYLKGEEE